MGNWLNTDYIIENIERYTKDMPALSENHTNPNLGVTIRGKESLVVTDSYIVVFGTRKERKAVHLIHKASSPTPPLAIEP